MSEGQKGAAAIVPLVALEQQLALAEAVQRVLGRGASAVGLTLNEARVLIYLASASKKGEGILATQISAATGIAPSRLSAAVRSLQANGLIDVDTAQSADKRRRPLRIAADGWVCLDTMRSLIGMDGQFVVDVFRMTTGRSQSADKARRKLLWALMEPLRHDL